MTMQAVLPTITDQKRGSYTLKETDLSALRALAGGYPRIDFKDGLRLIFLGLADTCEAGLEITAAGLRTLGESAAKEG